MSSKWKTGKYVFDMLVPTPKVPKTTSEKNISNIVKPYFTTKKNGTGLGLPIVNKIINDHNGTLKIIPNESGAKIKINIPKNVN